MQNLSVVFLTGFPQATTRSATLHDFRALALLDRDSLLGVYKPRFLAAHVRYFGGCEWNSASSVYMLGVTIPFLASDTLILVGRFDFSPGHVSIN